jgi:hypothetical protein
MQRFLDLFKESSVIRFPEHSMRLVLGASEDKRVIITEIFQKVWAELSKQTLSTILKHLETKDDVAS